jgi:tetratricopeptide (TPR) repeat protein
MSNTFEKNLKEGLKKSPVFNFSLGSKELFHSNFIAWLAKKYPENTGKLFSQFLRKQDGDVSISNNDKGVKREKQNRDIWFVFKNGQELIIENKVKSIPNYAQLENYSKEAESNQNFLLLTLVKSSNLPNGWTQLTYAELSELMEKHFSDLSSSYDSQIIKDYIFVISSLSRIFKDIKIKPEDKFNFYSKDEDAIYKALDDLRMGDVYQKLKYQVLAIEIYDKLINIFPNEKIFFNDTINRFKDDSPEKIKDKDRKEGCFYFGCGLSRAQGMMEVAYVLKKGLFLTIQIQGDRYKKMVQGYAGYKKSGDVAKFLKEKKLWFGFAHIGSKLKEFPKEVDDFNHYGKFDFYRAVSLSSDFTIENIIQFVIDDIKMIKNSLVQIKKFINIQ